MNRVRTLTLACFTALTIGCEREPPVSVRASVVQVYSSAEWIDLHRGFEPQMDDSDPKVEAVAIVRVTVDAPNEDAALTIANYWTQFSKVSCIALPNTGDPTSNTCQVFGYQDVVTAFSPMTAAQPMRSKIVPSHGSDGHAVAEIDHAIGLSCPPEEFLRFDFQLVVPSTPLKRDFRSKNRSHHIDLPPFESWKFESGSPMVNIIAPSAGPTPPAQRELHPGDRIRMIGYEGLNPDIRARDLARINQFIPDSSWPTRELFDAGSLEGFPLSVGSIRSSVEPLPIYVIVDPAEIDRAWGQQPQGVDAIQQFPPIDGAHSECLVFSFAPIRFPRGFTWISPPWPSWADESLVDHAAPPSLALETYNWSAISVPGVAQILEASALKTVSGESPHSFDVYAVSSTVWRTVIAPGDPYRKNPPLRGTLVFPLFESVGLLRDKESDVWQSERNGPMSSHVESPDFEWKLLGRSAFVLAKPLNPRDYEPRREFVTLPESVARLPVPIVSLYKAQTWKPLAEDFVLRVGPPTTIVDLRAVCIFMACSDEHLKAVAAAMGSSEPR